MNIVEREGTVELNRKQKVGITIIYTIIVVAVGRYLAPEKVRIETKTVEVEKKVSDTKVDKDTDRHTKITKVETTKPNGEKVVTTVTEDDRNTRVDSDTKIKEVDSKSTDTVKEITKSSSKLNISLLGGVDVTNPNKILLGGHVTKDILGPINIGIFGLSNGVLGASVGLTF